MVPAYDPMCAHVLEEEGVFGFVKLQPLQLDLIPADKDVLTMQCSDVFKTLQLYRDTTPMQSMANAISRIENIYGLFFLLFFLPPSCGSSSPPDLVPAWFQVSFR
jgi:hypothetical protein